MALNEFVYSERQSGISFKGCELSLDHKLCHYQKQVEALGAEAKQKVLGSPKVVFLKQII